MQKEPRWCKIGVTGTREGANAKQLEEIGSLLSEIHGVELHHGDCVGVDEQTANIARALGYRLICHPPVKTELRAYVESDQSMIPLGYLQRDRNIVQSTQLLIVVPAQDEWQPRGGTWYTHDHAVRKNKPIVIIYPNKPTTHF